MKKMRSRRNTPKYEAEGPFFDPQPGRNSTKNIQPAPFFSPAAIQRKLTVSAANSPAEAEADQMAGQVVQRLEQPEPLQRAVNEEEEKEKVQRQPLEEKDKLQKQAAPEEEEKVQTKPAGNSPAPTAVAQSLQSSKGGGRPLPAALRSGAEQALGADFGSVRVHSDAESARMNEALHAQAFTHGHDVYFNEGKYRPETTDGKRLLGHELGHVVQQNPGAGIYLQQQNPASPQQAQVRPVTVTVSGTQTGVAVVSAYPDTSSTNYSVPLYRVTVSGTSSDGQPASYDFNAIRFGVQYDPAQNIGPRIVGLSDAQQHNLSWHSFLNGSWRVYNGFFIHIGADNPATTAWGAIGCVEITGAGQWGEFNNRIRELSGNNDLTAIGASNQLTVTFESAERPPLSPVTPSQSAPEPGSTTPAR